MKRTIVKGFCDTFLKARPIIAVILLTAIICVLIGTAGTSHGKTSSHRTLPSDGIVTELNTVSQPSLTKSEIKTVPEQPRPNSTANEPVDNSRQPGEWQSVQMRVTAYCPCEKCCGQYSDGITACGHKIRIGDAFVAADKEYPFGTEMVIAGYNDGQPVKVLDRGGAIVGNHIDVFFHSHQDALNWGVRNIDVKVRLK